MLKSVKMSNPTSLAFKSCPNSPSLQKLTQQNGVYVFLYKT